jgi:hypothetical protein
VKLEQGGDTFAELLDRAVLIFENIDELELNTFSCSERGDGDDKNEKTVSEMNNKR